ncbi:hypothetical protein V6N13_111123 [Hibiscus sabdariffa]|uniref:Uncharacterized protein n=1 Tax=Hibiscus sabdariffa TaxID=183260 RepID=A0ABR2TJ74_9ROSI
MADTEAETERWMKQSIYRVPAAVADLSKKAYMPQVVSFGPYHQGKDHLMPMEDHKKRTLLHFLKRSNKPLEAFVNSLVKDVEKLKECYDLLDPIWGDEGHKFLQMMILDGCFVLEILRYATCTMEDYAQLPCLHSLVAVDSNGTKVPDRSMQDGEFINKLILKFCSPNTPISAMGTLLARLGRAGNEVTSYIFFMDNIIDKGRDVALLHSSGIIQNALGSDKAMANLFNSLLKDITLKPDGSLDEVQTKVNKYCKRAWNEWRANLIHTYFRNPWAILSLIAALLLFALTIAQTVYTIHPDYQESPTPPPLTPAPKHMVPSQSNRTRH